MAVLQDASECDKVVLTLFQSHGEQLVDQLDPGLACFRIVKHMGRDVKIERSNSCALAED